MRARAALPKKASARTRKGNTTRSRAKLGKLVEAREAYIKVIQENLPASAPKAFLNAQSAAQEELPAVEARIPKLTIQVEPAAVEGLSIELDGAAISAALVGVPTPINPGEHQIVAKSPGQRGEARITLAEGERQEIQVQLKPDTATPATTPAAQNAEPGASQSPAATESSAAVTPQDASSVDRKTWGYVAGGAGIALVGVGATFAILAKGQLDDAESDPELCPGKVCSADGRSEVDSASTKAWIATAGFGVGAAALAASAYLLLTDDSPPTSTTARGLRVAPGVAREGGFVSVAGAF